MSDLVKADPRTEDTPLPPAMPADDLPPATSEPEPLDPGKAELARLRAEAEAEEAAGGGAPPDRASAAPQRAAEPVPAPAAPAEPAAPIMVPKARLDEALTRARAAEAAALRMEGMLQAVQRMPAAAPAAPAAPPAPTLEQLIQAEEVRIEEAATRFDAGEIAMVEFKRLERDAMAKIQGLREQALYEAVTARLPSGQPMSMTDQIFLDRRTAELEAANPWVQVIIQGGRIEGLVTMARAELAALGEPIQGDSPMETLRLREKVAELSGLYGPRWFPQHQTPAAAPAAPVRAPAAAPVARPAAPAAPAANALARVAAHPPNINQMGSTALASNDPTDEQIAAMTTDEIGALPPTVRARLRL
jgi:hypothetical protein